MCEVTESRIQHRFIGAARLLAELRFAPEVEFILIRVRHVSWCPQHRAEASAASLGRVRATPNELSAALSGDTPFSQGGPENCRHKRPH